MISLFGEAKGLVGVAVFPGNKIDQTLFLQSFHCARGVGGFSAKAIEGYVQGAGVEGFDKLAVLEEAPEKDAFRAAEFQIVMVEKTTNFPQFIGGDLVLPHADLFCAAINRFLGLNDFLNHLKSGAGTIELKGPY